MPALTPEQQAFVERCWWYTYRVRLRYRAKYPGLDFDGAAGLRLCRDAPRYDSALSKWETWSISVVNWACAELVRKSRLHGYRKTPRTTPHPSVLPLGRLDDLDYADRRTPQLISEVENRDEIDHLLRGLSDRSRRVILETLGRGRSLRAVGADLGISDSRVLDLRDEALDWIRYREGLVPC